METIFYFEMSYLAHYNLILHERAALAETASFSRIARVNNLTMEGLVPADASPAIYLQLTNWGE